TVTLIPNGIHHPPIEDGRLLPNSVKNDLDKNIWMLQAFIGKEALEDDDALDEDED
ncbi:hypothetical protein IHP68_12495, partial [Enterococcus faecium]|nr:hypothetical protein [Enterococcus faecium]